jgi:hypothetical protein
MISPQGRISLAYSIVVVGLCAAELAFGPAGCPGPDPQSDGGRFKWLWGPQYEHPGLQTAPYHRYGRAHGSDVAARVRYWHQAMLDANALDHTPVAPGDNRVYGEQYGPCRTARAFAIVQIAVFDSLNAATGDRYESYTSLAPAHGHASPDSAVAHAAHDTLAALWPSQTAEFDALLAADLAELPDGPVKAAGAELGRAAAAAILALRAADGSDYPQPVVGVDYFTSDAPGKWRVDPVSMTPIAVDAYWGSVTPFVMRSAQDFAAPPPPALDSSEYAAAFDEVKRIGGDGITTPTERTAEQTIAGIFWAYDKTPGLGAPPRMHNQIAAHIAEQMESDGVELALLLAKVNVALADASIVAWDAKYKYAFWRPITGVREADPGTGPTGEGDGNPATAGDPTWTPLGAPASNLAGPNFTPPFPSYTSGHATFIGALFQTLRRFYGTDQIAFTFVSDEFNGMTQDNQGNVRPLIPRSFSSLSQAEEEGGQSRIYLGIHWAFDKTEGLKHGQDLADYDFENAFQEKERRKAVAAGGL